MIFHPESAGSAVNSSGSQQMVIEKKTDKRRTTDLLASVLHMR